MTATAMLKGTGNFKTALLNCSELFRDAKDSPCLQIHLQLKTEPFVRVFRGQ